MYRSLAAKHAIAYLLLFLIGIGLQGGLLLKNSSEQLIDSSEKTLVHITDLINIKSESYLEGLRRDITHLSKSPYLLQFIQSQEEKDRILLTEEYLSLISSKPDYAQIRFIGVADGGREIVRVERTEEEVSIVGKQQLQQKENRDYFIETIKLSENAIYISPIDLNKEYNEISLPKTPTLRVAFPVYHAAALQGIVVINTNLSLLFESLQEIAKGFAKLRLVNNEGFYVMHENDERTFGFEYNEDPIFVKEFGTSPKQLHDFYDKVFEHTDNLVSIQQISYGRNDYQIFIVLLANKNLLFRSYFQWRKDSFFTILALGVAFLLIAFFYMKRQTQELQNITSKIQSFPKTFQATYLPIDRKDEIGQLAAGFKEMAEVVSNYMLQLAEAKESAEQAVQEKEEFLENMSHEIRNPLQTIIGLCNILNTNAPAPHQVKLINSLRINAANLHGLVNNVLDYKKILRGDIEIEEHWFPLEVFLEEVYSSNNYFAITQKIKFTLDIDPRLRGKEIRLEKIRFTQILNNLILNAIKFTEPDGQVKLIVQQQAIEQEKALIRFIVKDTGMGIEPALLNKIKERYVSEETNHPFLTSSGLGLNIVSNLLRHWEATLRIDSEKGSGSSFYFDVWSSLKEAKPVAKSKEITHVALAQQHLLVIDDDIQIVELYRDLFRNKVKSITTVYTPEQLTKEDRDLYDIIITDYRLEGNTIVDNLTHLKAVCTDNTLLYIISATTFSQSSFLLDSLQVQGTFQKPIRAAVVLDTLNRDVLYKTYGIPSFDSIKKDYDYQAEKYLPAIQLLAKEWSQMSDRLQEAIIQKNKIAYQEVFHKLATTVRRLGLPDFETLLQAVGAQLKSSTSIHQQEQLVLEVMEEYTRFIQANKI